MGHLDAVIVGEKTYGKGVMQRTYNLSDKSAVTMTVAFYNPPSGENYDGVGILPDFEVSLTDDGDAQKDSAYQHLKELINKK